MLHPIQIKPGPPMPIPPDNCASVTERQLLARVAELEAQLIESERARTEGAMELLRCQSAMREWMVLSEKADDREVKARKDAEQLRAQLAAAREAVAEMRQDHRIDCARINLGQWGRDCDCGLTEILTARRALGLEAPND